MRVGFRQHFGRFGCVRGFVRTLGASHVIRASLALRALFMRSGLHWDFGPFACVLARRGARNCRGARNGCTNCFGATKDARTDCSSLPRCCRGSRNGGSSLPRRHRVGARACPGAVGALKVAARACVGATDAFASYVRLFSASLFCSALHGWLLDPTSEPQRLPLCRRGVRSQSANKLISASCYSDELYSASPHYARAHICLGRDMRDICMLVLAWFF